MLLIISIFFVPILQQSIFADHGKEIDLKFTTTYSVSDSDTVGKQINGVMEISTDNGTLIKTTSIPNWFKADKTGFQQFVTNLPDTSPKSITAIVLFTDLNKTSPM